MNNKLRFLAARNMIVANDPRICDCGHEFRRSDLRRFCLEEGPCEHLGPMCADCYGRHVLDKHKSFDPRVRYLQ